MFKKYRVLDLRVYFSLRIILRTLWVSTVDSSSVLFEVVQQYCIISINSGSHWYLSPTVIRSTTSVKMSAVSK